jgi:hypothetical protein
MRLEGRRYFPACAVILFLCGIFSANVNAQKDTGAIVGVVHDASGAVVAKAKVTVTDVDRGTIFAAETSEVGEYTASLTTHPARVSDRVTRAIFVTS